MSGLNLEEGAIFHFQTRRALAGMRLSRAVASQVPGLSVRGAKTLVDLGRVFVDNRRVLKASTALGVGEQVEVHLDRGLSPPALGPEDIVWLGSSAAAISKPAGIAVYGTHGVTAGTVIPRLAELLTAAHGGLPQEGLIPVHRLDRDTSGLLLVARNLRAARLLEEQFLRRQVEKRYLAIVQGEPRVEGFQRVSSVRPRRPPGEEREPARSAHYRTAKSAEREPEARTAFTLLETFSGCALVEARPDTGRTHQIRIHLAQLGHPILGDVLYSPQTVANPWFRAVPRQMLHAAFLAFRDPETGERVELEAPLPQDMLRVLAGLRAQG
jgi:23S rRNA pseudouridine1911/1915/1917 synthase